MTTLVIIAKYKSEPEKYSIWIDLEAPECRWCDCDMHYYCDTDDEEMCPTWLQVEDYEEVQEVWQCPYCHGYEPYMTGEYGEKEVEITRDEWDARESEDRQRWALLKRYGTPHPKNIHDYWQANHDRAHVDPELARLRSVNAREDARRAELDARERRRLCDPVRLAHDLKAIARIRRERQLARSNRAVAYERIAAAYTGALARKEKVA